MTKKNGEKKLERMVLHQGEWKFNRETMTEKQDPVSLTIPGESYRISDLVKNNTRPSINHQPMYDSIVDIDQLNEIIRPLSDSMDIVQMEQVRQNLEQYIQELKNETQKSSLEQTPDVSKVVSDEGVNTPSDTKLP